MQFARIVLLTCCAVVAYGVLHDQITVRICLEYFTLGHPPVFPATSATLLALAWGIATSLPTGLAFGFLLASVAVNGRRRPPVGVTVIGPPLGKLVLAMGTAAIVAGLSGFLLSRTGLIELHGELAGRIAQGASDRYLATRWAHGASYLVGLAGSPVVLATAWRRRSSPRNQEKVAP